MLQTSKSRGLADSRWAAYGNPTVRRRRSLGSSRDYDNAWAGQTSASASAGNPVGGTTRGSTTSTITDATHTEPTDSKARNAALTASQELDRYTKIVRRLKWKFPYLAAGYNQATAPGMTVDEQAEAETMFKLDFFEYYMLLERALVHLLGVFGIVISSGLGSSVHRPGLGSLDTNGNGAHGGRKAYFSTHSYHHNVLAALDSEDNPLHHVLGTGEARRSLARAKDLRNRWKYIQEEEDAARNGGEKDGKSGRVPLENYDLERMLACIFDGFDIAYQIAELRVAERKLAAGESWTAGGQGRAERSDWDFMVDAMDWEAV
jgi:hypothetical protein